MQRQELQSNERWKPLIYCLERRRLTITKALTREFKFRGDNL